MPEKDNCIETWIDGACIHCGECMVHTGIVNSMVLHNYINGSMLVGVIDQCNIPKFSS